MGYYVNTKLSFSFYSIKIKYRGVSDIIIFARTKDRS